ncbi:helix-turn-helix domain-containing protein [Paenibacillus sp. KN14-4R]|uniref:helix-turn-helix domain-containing protein n=1 Tax=Paenibacillus sp. KN14-4R TaxID=3445773 RepID=UPI003FA07A3A
MDGLAIQALRYERGMSQVELARAIGISQPRLSEMETGLVPVTLRVRIRVAQVFNINDEAIEMIRRVKKAEQVVF